MKIGIDFGTCYSTVAVMDGNVPNATVTDITQNSVGVPSEFVCVGNEVMYGYDCRGKGAYEHYADIVKNMKREFRADPDGKIESGGKSFEVKNIVKGYLKYLLDLTKKGVDAKNLFCTRDIEEITVTMPEGTSLEDETAASYSRLLTDALAEITGLSADCIHTLGEPIGASISYLAATEYTRLTATEQTILLFDFGGGTLDLSIVAYKPNPQDGENKYSVKRTLGDLKMGGNNWSKVLAQLALKKANVKEIKSPDKYARFMEFVDEGKCRLSQSEETFIIVESDTGESSSIKITREEFEAATKKLLESVVKTAKQIVNDYDGKIDKIVMSGGSSNIPSVQRGLKKAFPDIGDGNIFVSDPSKSIAKGAAIYSQRINDEKNREWKIGEVALGGVDHIAQHTYGFDCRNSYYDDKLMIYNVIYKNQSFGSDGYIERRSGNVIPVGHNQDTVAFKVYESDAKRGTDIEPDFIELDQGNYKGLTVKVKIPEVLSQSKRSQEYEMYALMRLDTDGKITLRVYDKDGNEAEYVKDNGANNKV